MATRTNSSKLSQAAGLDPKAAADQIVHAHKSHSGWLDAFAEHLDRQRNAQALKRILSIWGLNQSDAARIFGVSRQAISKWFDAGVPPDRAVIIADLGAATDLLVRHIKRDRVPGVVRRRAANLGEQSLLDLLVAHRYDEVLQACRAMFAFANAHGLP